MHIDVKGPENYIQLPNSRLKLYMLFCCPYFPSFGNNPDKRCLYFVKLWGAGIMLVTNRYAFAGFTIQIRPNGADIARMRANRSCSMVACGRMWKKILLRYGNFVYDERFRQCSTSTCNWGRHPEASGSIHKKLMKKPSQIMKKRMKKPSGGNYYSYFIKEDFPVLREEQKCSHNTRSGWDWQDHRPDRHHWRPAWFYGTKLCAYAIAWLYGNIESMVTWS